MLIQIMITIAIATIDGKFLDTLVVITVPRYLVGVEMTTLQVAINLSLQQVDLEMIPSLVPPLMIGSGEMDIMHSHLVTKQEIILYL